MLKKVLVHARKSLKFATLLGIAAFLIIGLVAYFFKPTYRVILNNEQIGYSFYRRNTRDKRWSSW